MVASLALVTFVTGSVFACSGNYCGYYDTSNCIQIDVVTADSCCLTLDATGQRCWTCSRDQYYCFRTDGGDELALGQAYNCHSPGGSCF
jgi:hypothetical protein